LEEIQQAMKFVSKDDDETIADVERLEEDVSFLQYSCESVNYRTQGDALFTKYVNEIEELNFEMMWEILDMYKSASLSCREMDLENEAIAISRQERLFDKILKLKIHAKEFYRNAFDLAQCLAPTDLSKAAWFQECKNALERFQKRVGNMNNFKRRKSVRPIWRK
jgi:hypothetical protein